MDGPSVAVPSAVVCGMSRNSTLAQCSTATKPAIWLGVAARKMIRLATHYGDRCQNQFKAKMRHYGKLWREFRRRCHK